MKPDEQRISVEIDADGRIRVEAEGFSGEACMNELKKLLSGLGEWESVERKDQAGARGSSVTRASRPRTGQS